MEAKIHKDVLLFKQVLTHDKFGDHVEEARVDMQRKASSAPHALDLDRHLGLHADPLPKYHMPYRPQDWSSTRNWQLD